MRAALGRSESLCRSALVAMLLCTAGCASSGTTFNVPTVDPKTPPDVVLDVHFPQGPILTVTPVKNTPLVPSQLNGNDEISLVALCTDNDSGCRNIEIFADATTNNADGSVAPSAPGPPVAENLDPNATPGGTASQKRNVSVKLSVPQLRGTFAGLDIAESSLPPTSATFKLVDATGNDLDLLTVDGRNCNASGTLLKAAKNSSSLEALVTSADTTTIVLSAPNTGPFASGMQDIAVWNEATFWPAFGGKKTTITWIR